SRVGSMQYPETLPLDDHEVVLTFDDGPVPRYTNSVLETLASECVKATFFMVGQMARAYTIIPSGQSSSNYAINYVNATLTINPQPLTITANNVTQTFDNVPYSGANGVTYNGFVNGQNSSVLSGSITYGGNSQGAVNVGTYAIIPSGQTSSNYAITYVNGT